MGNTALITGAAKRIGKALALHLAHKGWNVALHYHPSATEALQLESYLNARFPGQSFSVHKANFENDSDTENLIPEIISRYGPFHLLINNASVFKKNNIAETEPHFFDIHFQTNIKAPFILSRNFARNCKSGNIINIADTRIRSNRSEYAAYTLSKKALWEFTKMAALEFAPHIRVNAIAPGVTLAPTDKDDAYLTNLATQIPMKTPSGTEPVLKCVDFILSNNHLTGQLLYADGGENLAPK